MKIRRPFGHYGFTIVEITVVVTVIAILAGLVIVGYGAWRNNLAETLVKSDLTLVQTSMEQQRKAAQGFPASPSFTGSNALVTPSDGITITYVSGDASEYCIQAVSQYNAAAVFHIVGSPRGVQEGACPPYTGPPINGWLALSGGNGFTCGISTDSIAYCWGRNNYGQLGNGSTDNSSIPTAVSRTGVLAGKTAVQISAGDQGACMIASDSQGYCWGRNTDGGGTNGGLGDGSTKQSNTPVAVSTSGVLSGKTLTSIVAGTTTMCAIASDQRAYCWGAGTFSLGTGSSANAAAPVAVSTSGVLSGKNVTKIVSGGTYPHTCVIASGAAYCWGSNNQKVLGTASVPNGTSLSPVAVDTSGVLSGKTVTDISTGGYATCVIAASQPYCWGSEDRLGNGSSGGSGSYVPVAVTTSGVLSGKTSQNIYVNPFGGGSACVRASDDKLYCWGYTNTNGEAGRNLTPNSTPSPNPTGSIFTASPLSSGTTFNNFTMGEKTNCTIISQEAYCAGDNAYGQIGNNDTADVRVPTLVTR